MFNGLKFGHDLIFAPSRQHEPMREWRASPNVDWPAFGDQLQQRVAKQQADKLSVKMHRQAPWYLPASRTLSRRFVKWCNSGDHILVPFFAYMAGPPFLGSTVLASTRVFPLGLGILLGGWIVGGLGMYWICKCGAYIIDYGDGT